MQLHEINHRKSDRPCIGQAHNSVNTSLTHLGKKGTCASWEKGKVTLVSLSVWADIFI